MQSCGKRVTSAVLTAAVASLSLLVVGCEKESADLRVHKTIKESVQTRTTSTEQHIDAAIQLLGKTIGEQEASPASKALSRAALGQAERLWALLEKNRSWMDPAIVREIDGIVQGFTPTR